MANLMPWMVEGGQKAIQSLTAKGLLSNPEEWRNESQLAAPTPQYLLWIMLDRVAQYKGIKK